MKLREFFYLLGMRPALREYPIEVVNMPLEREPDFQFAHWRHPKIRKLKITQAYIDDLRTFLRAGDVCIDVGAHCGDTTVPMALAVGAAGTVFGFEPNPHVYKALKANAELNKGRANIVALDAAATQTDGTFTFEYSDPGFCNGGRHEGISKLRHAHFFPLEVKGVNVPNWLAEHHPDAVARVRYVKTDTDGFELVVLRSLEPLLRAQRPYVRAEVYKHAPRADREALYDFLAGLDYDLHLHESMEKHCGAPIARSQMMDRATFDLFAVPKG